MRGQLLPYVVVAAIAACSGSPRAIVVSGPTMGTTYTVKVVPTTTAIDAAQVRESVEQVLARIDRQMSIYRPDSEISLFNASSSTDWMTVSPELAIVVSRSLAIGAASGGALDITVGPLVDLWGFGPSGERNGIPADEEIVAARRKTGLQHLHVSLQTHSLRKDIEELRVDLNAVAPGFAVDEIASRLKQLGVERFMIELGGEVTARGLNAEGEPWRVAVERPVDEPSVPYCILALRDAAVATSGDYRHYYSYENRRYSHTIDPRTGHPVEHALGAVVVVAPSTFDADAWATALNVLGPDAGLVLAMQQGMAAMFVLRVGTRLRRARRPNSQGT